MPHCRKHPSSFNRTNLELKQLDELNTERETRTFNRTNLELKRVFSAFFLKDARL